MQEAMRDMNFPIVEGVVLIVLSLYGLGLGVLLAVTASFVTTRFIQDRTYEDTYLIFSLAMGGAAIGLLLTLPFAVGLFLCTHISKTCYYSLHGKGLELSFEAVKTTPSLGAFVGLVVGYWKLLTEYR